MHRPIRSARLAFALSCPLVLAACATGDRPYPSLQRRAAERQYGVMTPVPAAAETAAAGHVQAGLSGKLDALRATALAAHRQFESRQSAAARSVAAARGSAVASENWSVAQVALAQLESARSNAMVALADLDALLVEAAKADAAAPSPDLPAIRTVHGEVTGWIATEDAALASLRSQLRS